MSWRLARSLQTLLAEANEVAPNRRRSYDGTVGDAAHQARASRHNPNRYGVVTALDVTHDPERGMDTYDLFDWLRTHPHPDLAYVISNRRVARRPTWMVEAYHGSNPHDHHIHVAVGTGPDSAPLPPYDDTDSWRLREWKGADMDEETVRRIVREEIEAVNAPADVAEAQQTLLAAGIISRGRTPGKAASVGYVDLVLSRVLRKLRAV